MIKEENIPQLSVEELLGLLNSPQDEIVNAVRNLIKDQFSSISDKWLVTGLLDHYFLTNSKRMLDLLMGAPEPHCKFLLERISSGMKSGEKFRYLNILLYAVSRNPSPIWIHKIPSLLMRDLLEVLWPPSPSREVDMNVLVSGVMIVVLLLPALPFEFNKYLPKVFECFWRLVHWTPNRENDLALKPYLQVAVYSLFQRLYALYPCNLLSYLRINMVGQAKKSWFLSTLRPMLERVRLHPLLVSETKETEISKSRWVGLEPNDLIQECAKLCLDPLHEICEEIYFFNPVLHRQSVCEVLPETSDFMVLCSSENSFWSPGVVQSPSTANTSVPHTPVYHHLLGNHSTGIAESPPEAAIEATPETTPFASPSPYMASKPDPRITNQLLPKLKTTHAVENSQENRSPSDPLSPVRKDGFPFKISMKPGQEMFLKSEKPDILQTKLQEIQRQRQIIQKDDPLPNAICSSATAASEVQTTTSEGKGMIEPRTEGDGRREIFRQRKVAICRTKSSEELISKRDSDLFCENKESKEDSIERGNEPESPDAAEIELPTLEMSKRNSVDAEAGNSEGLGLPSRQSMTELMKSVKTNRLRFLSQCGPPPNLALLNDMDSKRKFSPSKPNKPTFLSRQKSRSFPDLSDERLCLFPSMAPRRDLTISSLTLSPVKPSVETSEAGTQTEEVPVIEPYEQLFELLTVPVQSRGRESRETKSKESVSPYQLLDQFIEHDCKDFQEAFQESGLTMLSKSLPETARNHLRAMQCVVTLERYKREVHAERNRRLLGKIKRLHLLQEKEMGLHKEKKAMKEEGLVMNQTLLKLQEKNKTLERKLNEMVEKRAMLEMQEKQVNAIHQRDHLKCMCESQQRDKSSFTKELENTRNSNREFQRLLKINARHSAENDVLRTQVNDLNRRLFLMGEIQMEMHQQMRNYKESQRHFRAQALATEKASFAQKIEEMEDQNRTDKTSLQAAMYRINELERKLTIQQKEKQNHQKEIEATAAMWQERCAAVEKGNHDLRSINLTLEGQITQLLRFRPERENEGGADSRRLVAPSGGDGFPLPESRGEGAEIPEPSGDSFVAQMTSNEFRNIGSPNPFE